MSSYNQNTSNNVPSMNLVHNLPLNGSNISFEIFDEKIDISNQLILIDEVNKIEVVDLMMKYQREFEIPTNFTIIPFEDNYKYRPDLIAKKYYGSDLLYPLVLMTNRINSMINFVPEMNMYKLKIINLSLLKTIFKK